MNFITCLVAVASFCAGVLNYMYCRMVLTLR